MELRKIAKDAPDSPAALSVEGADLVSYDGKIELKGVERLASPDQVVTLRLANLVPGSRLRVHARQKDVEMKGSPADVFVLESRERPAAKKE